MGQKYNSQNVCYGSFVLALKKPATSGAGTDMNNGSTSPNFICENVTISRPFLTVERPDNLGGPNGFAINDKQETGSMVVQVPKISADAMDAGVYFEHNFGYPLGATVSERFVINSVGQAFDMGAYWKVNCGLIKDQGAGANGGGTAAFT